MQAEREALRMQNRKANPGRDSMSAGFVFFFFKFLFIYFIFFVSFVLFFMFALTHRFFTVVLLSVRVLHETEVFNTWYLKERSEERPVIELEAVKTKFLEQIRLMENRQKMECDALYAEQVTNT